MNKLKLLSTNMEVRQFMVGTTGTNSEVYITVP